MEDLVNPSVNFWRHKKVLLTGHTGFKGAWLYLWLKGLGAQVHGFSLPPATKPNLAELAGIVENNLETTFGDVRDELAVNEVMKRVEPEIVLHLAAQALVRQSYTDPVESFTTNVVGTLRVLEAAASCASVRAVLVVTSDKCYENQEWLWPYRENEPLGGHDPYSASKACQEIATSSWRASMPDMHRFADRKQPLAIATARAGNVFGGGDWAADRLVPDYFRAQSRGTELTIRNPNARRPWQHVLEPLAGYLLLAEKLWCLEAQEAWNFGPGMDDVQPVSFIIDKLSSSEPPTRNWQLDSANQPHEAGLLALDSTKARSRLGWRPRLPLVDALEWTSSWYSRQSNGELARDLTETQIQKYTNLAHAGHKTNG